MAREYKKTSEMNPAGPLTGNELVAIVQGGDRQSTLAEIAGLGWTNYGYAASGEGPGLSVDTVAQTVTVSGRVVSGRRTKLMPAPVTLPYTAGPNQLISVSMDDGTALLTEASAAHTIPTAHAILGTLNPNNGRIIGAGGEYFIDGLLYDPADTEAKYGYISSNSGTGISVDTTAKTVTLQGRLTSGPRHRLIATPEVLPYSGNTALIISASLATGEGLLSSTASSAPLPREHVILGTLNIGTGQISGAGGEYLLNGQRYMPPITIPKTTATADLWGTPSSVQVDTTAKTITFASGVRVSDGRRTRSTNAFTLNYTGESGSFFIVIDDGTGNPRLVPSNQLQNLALVAEDDFVLGFFRTATGRISGLAGGFTLDGVEQLPEYDGSGSAPPTPTKMASDGNLWGTPASVLIDTTAKTITFASGIRISSGRFSRLMPGYTLDYTGQTGTFFIVIDDGSGNPRLVPGNQIQNTELVTPDDIILGQFRTATGALSGFPGGYTLNGVEYLPDLPGTSGPVVPEKVAENAQLWGITSTVQVDTSAQTITIASGVRMSAGRRSRTTNAQVLSYAGESGVFFIVYNDSNGDARLVASNQLQNTSLVTPDDLIVGQFRTAGGIINGLPGGYRIDGVDQLPDTPLTFLSGRFFGNQGAPGVTINSSTNIITFNGVLVADGFSAVLSGTTYNYSGIASQTGWRYLTYNRTNNSIGVQASSGIASLSANSIVFMGIRPSTLELQGLTGTARIDDNNVGGNDRNYCIPLSDSATIDVDFIDKKVKMGGNMQVLHRGFRALIIQQEIDFSHIPDGVWSVLIYDPKTDIASATLASQRHGDLVLVLGAIKTDTQSVVGFVEYSVNGVPERQRATWTRRSASLPWDFPYDITIPALPGHTSSDPMPLATMTTADIYSLYDGLMADYPDYITKNLLGNDASGLLPIYEYRFTPEVARTEELAQGAPEHMRAMLLSLHSEQINYVYPYYLMRAICEDWPADPALEALRFGVEWSVVPALNPYAVNNNQRPNFNGVDLNRNFPSGWNLTSVGEFYSGPTPASEPETQYAYALLKTFRPHIVFDCHSFGQKAAPIADNVFWIASSDDKIRATVGGVITRLGHKWQGENAWMPPPNRLGYTAGSRGSGLFRTTALDLGAASVLFEAAWSLADEPGGSTRGSALAVRYATEGLANCVAAVAKLISK